MKLPTWKGANIIVVVSEGQAHLNIPLDIIRMPLRNKKSHQASSQQVAGNQKFQCNLLRIY